MKEDADVNQLLEGCPPELLQIPLHLKTLGYADEPDYPLLERCLTSTINRLGILMDDPYDWELGYENTKEKEKTKEKSTGAQGGNVTNVSTRMRSHTTAVRDRAPDDVKNRAMDTQAPITMEEDDDEQTGNNYFNRYILLVYPF